MKSKIVAVRGNGIYLIQTAKKRGHIFSAIEQSMSDEMDLDAFLKFGYWEPYSGNLRPEDLITAPLKNIKPLKERGE